MYINLISMMYYIIAACLTLFVGRRVEKESLAEYINKKREMFLVQVLDHLMFVYLFVC